MVPEPQELIRRNVRRIAQRIAAAAQRAGRRPESVRLVAVTKYVDATLARLLVAEGCRDLGESRPQQLWEKANEFESWAAHGAPEHDEVSLAEVRWHLIGHLQRNKVRRTLPFCHLIHSVDSLRLLEELQRASDALAQQTAVLLEVNVSQDAEKHGFPAESVERALQRWDDWPNLELRGLMTMASRVGGQERASHDFGQLRQLRDRLQDQFPQRELSELSMGMSGDLEAAIAQGATIVRVGSALFEGLLEDQ